MTQSNNAEGITIKDIWAGAAGVRSLVMLLSVVVAIAIAWTVTRETANSANEKADSAVAVTQANTKTLSEIKGKLELMEYKENQAEKERAETAQSLKQLTAQTNRQMILVERLAMKFNLSTETE